MVAVIGILAAMAPQVFSRRSCVQAVRRAGDHCNRVHRRHRRSHIKVIERTLARGAAHAEIEDLFSTSSSLLRHSPRRDC